MINSVSFTGKEKTAIRTLTAGAERAEEEAVKLANKVAQKAAKVRGPKVEFVKPGTDLTGTYNEQVAQAIGKRAEVRSEIVRRNIVTNPADRYSSPFAPTNVNAEAVVNAQKAAVSAMPGASSFDPKTVQHIDFFA